MADECGCHSGYIPNGFVATSSCTVYSSACKVYCPYYCDPDYVKTASSVYCAGNDRWVPTGTHPATQTGQACRKNTAPYSECDSIFFENGYIITCPTARLDKKKCFFACYNGYKATGKTVDCTRDGWATTDTNRPPCVRDSSQTTVITSRPTTTTTTQGPPLPRTTNGGYYDDPSLKMDVSPVIFVAGVIGGIIVLALLVFAIFFRAHRKTSRENRRRASFIVSVDPLSEQNDHNNHQDVCPQDDSEFRDIARRIMDRSLIQQQENAYDPPPYDALSSANENGSAIVPFSPPYSAIQTSGTDVSNSVPYHSYDQQQISDTIRNTNALNHNALDCINGFADKPPPYELVANEGTSEIYSRFNERTEEIGPPPPYTTYEGPK